MTLYTDGSTPATDKQILSAASAIARGRQRVQRGGRKPTLSPKQQTAALMALANGSSINAVAKNFGVSWSTIRRLKAKS